MKTVRIAFSDFWEGFKDDPNCAFYSLVIKTLRAMYKVEEVSADENPQYLFYSCFGDKFRSVKSDCVKIFYTGEMFTPNFNECDYALGYDFLSFGDRYMRLPLYRLSARAGAAAKKHLRAQEAAKGQRGFCSFTVTNGYAQQLRIQAFEALNAYKSVASGGKYRNNVGGPVKDKIEFASKYKFSLCFENCVHSGYVTEKLTDAFAADTVPIYLGAPEVEEEINPAAFINCAGMSVNEIVDAVKRVDNDEKLYLSMLSAPAFLGRADDLSDFADFITAIFRQPVDGAKRIPAEAQFISAYNKKLKGCLEYYSSPAKTRLKADLKEIFKGRRK